MIPGEVLPAEGTIETLPGAPRVELEVTNSGDRPVQVGSHFHFAEANAALEFDRAAAWGHRLAVPAGTSVRFEPGIPRDVELVPLAGRRVVPGLRGLAAGPLVAAPVGLATGFIAWHPRLALPGTVGTPLLIYAAIAVPEEFLFRGLIQNALDRLLSPWTALGVASVVFGLAHLPDPRYVLLATIAPRPGTRCGSPSPRPHRRRAERVDGDTTAPASHAGACDSGPSSFGEKATCSVARRSASWRCGSGTGWRVRSGR